MASVTKYDSKGASSGQFNLEDGVFGDRIKVVTAQEALLRQLSNRRRALAKAKDRSEVRGGGKKPWRQKGTGRARAGSSRSPLWVGGGVAMGPRGNANYTLDMPRKARRAAIRSLLTKRTRGGDIAVIADVALERPKTKSIVELLTKMELGGKKVLFVIPQRDYNFECSVRNLPNVKALIYSNLNPHDLMFHDKVVVFEGAVSKLTEKLLPAIREASA